MGFWEKRVSGQTAPENKPLPPMPGQTRVPVPPPSGRGSSPRGSTTLCPECGSANYGSPSSSAAPRCFDCGFKNSYRNSTDNQSSVRAEGAVKAAKQIPVKSYKPNEIIGRIQ